MIDGGIQYEIMLNDLHERIIPTIPAPDVTMAFICFPQKERLTVNVLPAAPTAANKIPNVVSIRRSCHVDAMVKSGDIR